MIEEKYYKKLSKLIEWVDGKPVWKKKSSKMSRIKIGSFAGNISKKGYLVIGVSIDSVEKTLYAHRLHWYMVNGTLPKIIDHINRDKLDNRIDNLREVTESQSHRNINKKNNTSSIYMGVTFINNKWRSAISINKKLIHLGSYDCEHCAGYAYDRALIKYGLSEYGNFNFSV